MNNQRTIKDYLKVAGSWVMNPDNNPAMILATVIIVAACVFLSFANVGGAK